MNYLTNYYKNLAEKLEYQVNNLENQVKFINEAMSNYGPSRGRQMGMGDSMYLGSMTQGDLNNDGMVDGADLGLQLGRGGNPNDITSMYSSQYQVAGPAFRSTTSGRRPGSRGRPEMSDSSYEGSRIPGDYNGDGRVDGADLGLGLSNNYGTSAVTQNWTLPYQQGGPAFMRMANRGPTLNRGRSQMGMGDSYYGGSRTPGDLNNDGMVDGADLGLQLGSGGNPNDIVSNYTPPYQVGGRADFRSTNPNRNRRRSR